jgi:hypothetical protein
MNQLITNHSRHSLERPEMSEATIPVQAAGPAQLNEDGVSVSLGLGVFIEGRCLAPILVALN